MEERFDEKIDVWYNLYNFISFWYDSSMLDGILNHDKIFRFIEDFLDNNETFNNKFNDKPDEDFEKVLIKLHKKLKKVKPGSFES